jgi:hypothetical protein
MLEVLYLRYSTSIVTRDTHARHLPNIRRIQRLKKIQVSLKLEIIYEADKSQGSCSWEPRISGQVLELQ